MKAGTLSFAFLAELHGVPNGTRKPAGAVALEYRPMVVREQTD
jgi:hypothetical protein